MIAVEHCPYCCRSHVRVDVAGRIIRYGCSERIETWGAEADDSDVRQAVRRAEAGNERGWGEP